MDYFSEIAGRGDSSCVVSSGADKAYFYDELCAQTSVDTWSLVY